MKKKKKQKKINYQKIFSFLKYFFFLLVFIFLLLNIFYSQNISPLYLGLINYDKSSYIEFLKKIKPLPIFQKQIKIAQNFFGKKIVNEVFLEEKQLNEKITKLETALKKNPKARDVLYALYQLYKEKGDKKKAYEYLRKAKEVDPLIENLKR